MAEAGILGMMRRTGYLRFYRSAAGAGGGDRQGRGRPQDLRRQLRGASTRRKLAELEPHLRGPTSGGVLMPEPVSVADPGGVTQGLRAAVRGARRALPAGRCAHAGADCAAAGRCAPSEGPVAAGAVVVALGPWSDDVFRPLGLSHPARRQARLSHAFQGARATPRSTGPSSMSQHGYALTPMVKGIRLTTGAEFALRDAPPTPGAARRASSRWRARSSRWASASMPSRGSGAAPACPTCCP